MDTAAGAAEEEQVACIAAASPAPLTDSCGPTDQELMLTEQAAQCLELPHDLGDEEAGRKRRPKCSPKNTFYFYQGKCVSLSQSYGLNSMSFICRIIIFKKTCQYSFAKKKKKLSLQSKIYFSFK